MMALGLRPCALLITHTPQSARANPSARPTSPLHRPSLFLGKADAAGSLKTLKRPQLRCKLPTKQNLLKFSGWLLAGFPF